MQVPVNLEQRCQFGIWQNLNYFTKGTLWELQIHYMWVGMLLYLFIVYYCCFYVKCRWRLTYEALMLVLECFVDLIFYTITESVACSIIYYQQHNKSNRTTLSRWKHWTVHKRTHSTIVPFTSTAWVDLTQWYHSSGSPHSRAEPSRLVYLHVVYQPFLKFRVRYSRKYIQPYIPYN